MSTSTPAVIVVGELLVDIVQSPDGGITEHVGGSPANVALGLARLGHDTHIATIVGTDERGRRCTAHMDAGGVHLLPGSTSDAHPTSVAQATIDRGGAATYVFDLHWELPPVRLPSTTGHLHTGSIATTLHPGAANITEVLHRGREVATVSYDPNVRPSIMGDADAVRPRVEELVTLADVVKCSSDDLLWLYPDRSPEQVMEQWSALGA
ncbi:MAG: PfkB family carbohydrate kinase, partial [Dermatophilaceae bacterium]